MVKKVILRRLAIVLAPVVLSGCTGKGFGIRANTPKHEDIRTTYSCRIDLTDVDRMIETAQLTGEETDVAKSFERGGGYLAAGYAYYKLGMNEDAGRMLDALSQRDQCQGTVLARIMHQCNNPCGQ